MTPASKDPQPQAETPEGQKARRQEILTEWARSHDALDGQVPRGNGVDTVYTLDQRVRAVLAGLKDKPEVTP